MAHRNIFAASPAPHTWYVTTTKSPNGNCIFFFAFISTTLTPELFRFHKVFALVVACYGPILNSLLISSMQ